MKLIDLHKECCESGKMPKNIEGLCDLFDYRFPELNDLFSLVRPQSEQFTNVYWGSGEDNDYKLYQYTPLRQTIVLLICCMNGEL